MHAAHAPASTIPVEPSNPKMAGPTGRQGLAHPKYATRVRRSKVCHQRQLVLPSYILRPASYILLPTSELTFTPTLTLTPQDIAWTFSSDTAVGFVTYPAPYGYFRARTTFSPPPPSPPKECRPTVHPTSLHLTSLHLTSFILHLTLPPPPRCHATTATPPSPRGHHQP